MTTPPTKGTTVTTTLNPAPSWASHSGLVRIDGPDRTTSSAQAIDKILCVETVNRFAFAYDEQDAAVLADCFTEDAVLHATTAGTQDFGAYEGRDAVVGWLSAYWGRTVDQRRHIVTNAVVDGLTDDAARVTTMLLVTAAQDGAFRPVTAGVYCAGVRRQDDGAWRIATFELGFDAAF
jgi:ketosteroid isomerase-like protein